MLYNGSMTAKGNQSGQILLITLLVLSIATTIALSLIARTTTDLNISNQVQESSRAFSAAEAGVEQALKAQTSIPVQTLSGGAQYSVSQANIGGDSAAYVFPHVTPLGEVETLWFVNHNPDGTPMTTRVYTKPTIDVCFSDTGSPAIEATIYYLKAGVYTVAKAAFDSISRANNFDIAVGGGCGAGTNTAYKKTITFSDLSINPAVDTLIMMRLRPLYANAQLAVLPTQALPLQGSKYDSCGKTGTGIQRCISVVQNYRTPSGLFDYVVYSEGSFAPVQ